jgi:quercetin dioxygenase-like cupin family protein
MNLTDTSMSTYNRQAEAYRSPYEQWKDSQGLPTIRGLSVANLNTVELTDWPARGGKGVFVNLDGTGGFNDMYVCELAPGASSVPIKHIYEETVFILKGQGATSVWNDPNSKQTFEWHARSYFAMPPNAWHQYHNLSGTDSVRYVAMTAAPRVLDTFKNLDFVFNNPYVFDDRFNGESGYFKESERTPGAFWSTNFVADVLAATPKPREITKEGRGGGTSSVAYAMVNSTVRSHSRAWPIGSYAKFHRHGPGIHVTLLSGTGYSLMGPSLDALERVDWAPGSMFVPPEGWWHAHFNTGQDPAAFLAIGWGSEKPKAGGRSYVYTDQKTGGDQWEFEDEDPQIHRAFEAELAKNGVRCMMGGSHPNCTQT